MRVCTSSSRCDCSFSAPVVLRGKRSGRSVSRPNVSPLLQISKRDEFGRLERLSRSRRVRGILRLIQGCSYEDRSKLFPEKSALCCDARWKDCSRDTSKSRDAVNSPYSSVSSYTRREEDEDLGRRSVYRPNLRRLWRYNGGRVDKLRARQRVNFARFENGSRGGSRCYN